jgi:hypothetical protein
MRRWHIPLVDRFWANVIPEPMSGCWLWTAGTDQHGYGQIWENSTKRWKAHRLSFTLHCGPIPSGLHVLHQCDNPFCVNPDHLFLGTPADNAADKVAKGRARGPGYFGTKHWCAKITQEIADEIRLLSLSGRSQRKLAAQFGLAKPTVQSILRGRTWNPEKATS